MSICEKIRFILLKYFSYVRKTQLSADAVSHVTLFGKRFHFTDRFGVASLQRVYCESHRLRQYVKEGAVIIDVGAHIGQFNFFCRHYLRAQRIVSIEPIRECLAILKLNAQTSSDCIHGAVSKTSGTVRFYTPAHASQHTSYVRDAAEEYDTTFAIRTTRLDDLLAELGISECDLLKVDTEGSEYDVLLSSEKLLEHTETVLVEMSISRASTGNLFTVGNFLQERGFDLLMLLPYSENHKTVDAIFRKNRKDFPGAKRDTIAATAKRSFV